jgi:hypothetical protein
VMCVISHSLSGVIWSNINACIVGIGHITVMCVISHSVRRVIWRNSLCIVGRSRISVSCVVSHALSRVLWNNINAYILGRDHIIVMCVIGHSVRRIRRHLLRHSGERPFSYDLEYVIQSTHSCGVGWTLTLWCVGNHRPVVVLSL